MKDTDKVAIALVDLKKLQEWQDSVDKNIFEKEQRLDKWCRGREELQKLAYEESDSNRKISIKHMNIVEGYLETLIQILRNLAK